MLRYKSKAKTTKMKSQEKERTRTKMEEKAKIVEIAHEMWPELDIENATGIIDNDLVDSFDIVTFISELKDAFDIEIGPQDILPENFNDLDAMINLVKSKLEA